MKYNWWKVFDLKYPIIQAPMAGSTPPEFVAACCEAGILGSLGAGYMTAEATRKAIKGIRLLTDRAFNVNLFVPENAERDSNIIHEAHTALRPFREELGLPDELPALSESEFAEQVDVIIEEQVPVVSFTFGLPGERTVFQLKAAGAFLIGTATTPEEAALAEQAGMDAVVLQGKEAGGHRGSFEGKDRFLPLAELLAVTRGRIPIIAAGGMYDAETVKRALNGGASAVQVGSALLVSEESGANPLHKQAILNSAPDATVITKAFSGKNARGLENCFTRDMAEATVAPYPIQNDLTKTIRTEAARQGNRELLSLWCGENGWRSQAGTVAEIVRRLAGEDEAD